MARKRKNLQHLDYKSNEYWQRLLVEDQLSLSQGEHPKLIYAGDSRNLGRIEESQLDKSVGRKLPKVTES